ncbi:MAG: hypothetical protein M1814_004153 [Vezdaea aestivalis]|nr:MAG: hypothetical protein M1814_004153 [Vezdaea aestivalis]
MNLFHRHSSTEKSPRRDQVKIRTGRLDTKSGAEPPKIQKFDTSFSPMMNGVNGFSPISHEPQPPSVQPDASAPLTNGSAPSDPSTPSKSSNPHLLSPTARTTSDVLPPSPLSPASLNIDSSLLDSNNNNTNSPQWSSAVGRAQTGKSGRVIERLMAENDRLRRELKVEVHKREEEQKKQEMARGKMEALQTANDNLIQGREVDRLALARRDRKLEDVKTDLDHERARRLEAENQLRIVQRETEESMQQMRRTLSEETERAKRASSQYEVLSTSWKHLDEGYRRKTERLKTDLRKVEVERQTDQTRLERLDVTIEQQRHELDKMRTAKEGVSKEFRSYKEESEASTRGIRERAERNERANEEALEETLRVLGEMRHVINVKKYVRNADVDGSVSRDDYSSSQSSS